MNRRSSILGARRRQRGLWKESREPVSFLLDKDGHVVRVGADAGLACDIRTVRGAYRQTKLSESIARQSACTREL